jgi:uncharacterized protein YecT (DUF1311 family)
MTISNRMLTSSKSIPHRGTQMKIIILSTCLAVMGIYATNMIYVLKGIRISGFALGFGMLLLPGHLCAQGTDACLSKNTQAEMSSCEIVHYTKAEANLNLVYKQLLAKYQSRTNFVQKLRRAQEAWVKFRDADVDSFYFERDKLRAYGSVYPMCKAIELIQLTIERTKELRLILNPQEDDVCGFLPSAVSDPGKYPFTGERRISMITLKGPPRQLR